MLDVAAIVLVILVGFQFLGTAVYLFLIRKVLVHLETNHTVTWRQLGEPSLFLNNSPRNSLLVVRFLWNKQYLLLQDAELTHLASRVRGLLVVLLGLFPIMVIGVFTLGSFQ